MWPFKPRDLLKDGIDALYEARLDVAKSLLEQASLSCPRPAAALSYLALAHRTSGHLTQALDLLDRAKSKDPTSFEPHAAESIIRLTAKDISGVISSYHDSTKLLSADLEGHFLKLLCFCLFSEMFSNSEETPQGATVCFKLTPVTRIAVLILDGRPKEAAKEPPPAGTPPPLWSLAHALALFRNGDPRSAFTWTDAGAVLLKSNPDIPIFAFRSALR